MRSSMPAVGLQERADPRTPITAWDLLVWTYKRQMVRYEGGGPTTRCISPGCRERPQRRQTGACAASTLRNAAVSMAPATAHDDAHTVHSFIVRTVERKHADLIMRAAERGSMPEWDPDLPPARVVPARKPGGGVMRMIYGKSNRPIACVLDYEGVPEHEAQAIRQAARNSYSACWRITELVTWSFGFTSDGLIRWKVTGIGIDRAPWTVAWSV